MKEKTKQQPKPLEAIEELASRVFSTRDIAHREHWATKSYAAHMALGDFYEGLPGAIDAIVEAYQGHVKKIEHFDVHTEAVDDIVEHLQSEADWVETNADEISVGSSSIRNLVDNLVFMYQAVIYKLRELS